MDENIGDLIALPDGRVLKTHGKDECSGTPCVLHSPSEHPLKYAPLSWRSDRVMMERICKHGIHHPDPDDRAHWERRIGEDPASKEFLDARARHDDCDGCCQGFNPDGSATEELLDKLQQYLDETWINGNPHDGPWPNDPDGGEMRIFQALYRVLELMQTAEIDGKLTIALFRALEVIARELNREQAPPEDFGTPADYDGKVL